MKHWSIIFLLLIGCQNNDTTEEPFKDFIEFYQQFHQDSAYQMEHIVFPLQGSNGSADPKGTFRWEKENWALHRPVDTTNFRQAFNPVDEKLIIEYLMHESGRFSVERRFAKTQDEWKLIYYAEKYGQQN